MIKINMTKAVDIKKDMLREERKPLLASLDIDLMKSLGNPEAVSEIEAEKQKLRDITIHPALTTAETPEELKAITLADLVG